MVKKTKWLKIQIYIEIMKYLGNFDFLGEYNILVVSSRPVNSDGSPDPRS
jgi:hypothetical protein